MRSVVIVAALAVASCQSATQSAQGAALQQRIAASQGAAVEQVCFTGADQDWDSLRRDVLLLEENKSWYMLDLAGSCDAEWAHARIAEKSGVEGSACLSAGDPVQSHDLNGTSICRVESIHAWKN